MLGFLVSVATAWIPAVIGYETSTKRHIATLADPEDADYFGDHEQCRFFELCTHRAYRQRSPSMHNKKLYELHREYLDRKIRMQATLGQDAAVPSWARVPLTMPTPEGDVRADKVRVFGFGWPRVCLRGYLVTPPSGVNKPLQYAEFWYLYESASHYHNLPVGPVWAGLGYNTAVFALPMFVVGWGLGVVRRWRRRRRGACERCGYSLAGNVGGVCPECGHRCVASALPAT